MDQPGDPQAPLAKMYQAYFADLAANGVNAGSLEKDGYESCGSSGGSSTHVPGANCQRNVAETRHDDSPPASQHSASSARVGRPAGGLSGVRVAVMGCRKLPPAVRPGQRRPESSTTSWH